MSHRTGAPHGCAHTPVFSSSLQTGTHFPLPPHTQPLSASLCSNILYFSAVANLIKKSLLSRKKLPSFPCQISPSLPASDTVRGSEGSCDRFKAQPPLPTQCFRLALWDQYYWEVHSFPNWTWKKTASLFSSELSSRRHPTSGERICKYTLQVTAELPKQLSYEQYTAQS